MKYLAALSLITLLSGCSTLIVNDKQTQLNQLLEQQRYDDAVHLVSNASAEDPIKQQLDSVLNTRKRYLDSIIEQSNSLQAEQQWLAAEQLLFTALEQNPMQRRLVNRYEQLLNQQQQQLREQRLALALSHAQALPQLLQQLTELLATDPTQTHLQHYRQSLLRAQINSADILQQAIRHSLRRNNIGDADRYLSALQNLQAEGDHSALAHRLQQLKQQKLVAQNQQQTVQKQQLAEDLEQALNNKQWLTAKMLIDQLASWATEDETTAKQLSDAQALLQRQVKKLVDLGQYHYTRSQLNQAIDYWQQAQALAPHDNDLNSRLQRAKTFRSNVEKLQ